MSDRIILGIDPGSALLGFGLVRGADDPRLVTCGAIETSPENEMSERLLAIYQALTEIIREHEPGELAIEQLFFARNVTTAIAVGQARGVVLLAAAQQGIPVFEYKPNEVKLAVAGYGGADKRQVQEMVKVGLNLNEAPQPDDAADALAVALCHVFTSRFDNIVQANQ